MQPSLHAVNLREAEFVRNMFAHAFPPRTCGDPTARASVSHVNLGVHLLVSTISLASSAEAKTMADKVASGASNMAANAAVKTYMSPSFNIVKTIPQGIIELGFRGAVAVS